MAGPDQGQLVDVRQRRYVVTEVAKGALTGSHLDHGTSAVQHLVTLSSLEEDALGEELQVIWELEQLRETQRDLRISPENIQKVVEIALELAGQPPLIPTEVAGIWPDPLGARKQSPVFRLPALRGSWALCSEGLSHPHTGAIRPIVFDHHLAEGRDDVVLAHLNHRLVQMSLRLLRAEVWAMEGRKRLHRVTARTVPDHALEASAKEAIRKRFAEPKARLFPVAVTYLVPEGLALGGQI
ncbi:MAG: hypothetical protein HY721_27065 [Planctomycetes bacterium]|nr:hypothetical protein [Planctomycetota bacterium]